MVEAWRKRWFAARIRRWGWEGGHTGGRHGWVGDNASRVKDWGDEDDKAEWNPDSWKARRREKRRLEREAQLAEMSKEDPVYKRLRRFKLENILWESSKTREATGFAELEKRRRRAWGRWRRLRARFRLAVVAAYKERGVELEAVLDEDGGGSVELEAEVGGGSVELEASVELEWWVKTLEKVGKVWAVSRAMSGLQRLEIKELRRPVMNWSTGEMVRRRELKYYLKTAWWQHKHYQRRLVARDQREVEVAAQTSIRWECSSVRVIILGSMGLHLGGGAILW